MTGQCTAAELGGSTLSTSSRAASRLVVAHAPGLELTELLDQRPSAGAMKERDRSILKEKPRIFNEIYLMAGGASVGVNAATQEVIRGHVWAAVLLMLEGLNHWH